MVNFRAVILLLFICLSILPGSNILAAVEGRWISFLPASNSGNSNYAVTRPVDPEALRGLLFQPEAQGPFPAVILIHGCRGLLSYQQGWAELIASWGYVVFLVDSFFTRHAARVCENQEKWQQRDVVASRVDDIYGAYDYLSHLPKVDSSRMGLLGWDLNATLQAVRLAVAEKHPSQGFRATVAFYPNCLLPGLWSFASPLLILTGSEDDWTPGENCKPLQDYAAVDRPVSLVAYKKAHHSFDDTALADKRWLPGVFNPARKPGRGATVAYSRAAHKKAIDDVAAFLQRYLQNGLSRSGSEARSTDRDDGHWVSRPQVYGTRYPSGGRSLFDLFFSKPTAAGLDYDIPFPLEKLQQRLNAYLSTGPSLGMPLKSLLVPFGRSLKREITDSRNPRAILAVDTDTRLDRGEQHLLLKNRLFIAHVAPADALEVISYNESAERFEFQEVKNYSAGKQAVVSYVQREICMACHQNAAPLFSAAPWDESNGNRDIASRLAAVQSNFYGVPAFRLGAHAAIYDNATDRANLLSTWQLLWRSGCGSDDPGLGCRAAVFQSMLQYRLSQSTDFDRQGAAFQDRVLGQQRHTWADLWPRGLKIPNGDIPNRNPVLSHSVKDIAARFDPLRQRPPHRIWRRPDEPYMAEFIKGLADDLSLQEIRQLDLLMLQKSRQQDFARRLYDMSCAVDLSRRQGDVLWLQSECSALNNPQDVELKMTLRGKAGKMSGSITWFQLPGYNGLSRLSIEQATIQQQESGQQLLVNSVRTKNGLHARLPSGERLEQLKLVWLAGVQPLAPNSKQHFRARLALRFIDDFALLRQGVEQVLAQAVENKSGSLLENHVYVPALMQELFRFLGLEANDWCCKQTTSVSPLPAVASDVSQSVSASTIKNSPLVDTLNDYCSFCHRTVDPFPPNFLTGDASLVGDKVQHCAQRMYYRLSMWQKDENRRLKTPMPPFGIIKNKVHKMSDWTEGSDYRSLLHGLRSILLEQSDVKPHELLQKPYSQLRSCLPVAGI